MRIILKLFVALVVLVVLLLIAAIVAVNLIDLNEHRDLIAQRVKQATGRELTIDGDLDLDLGLTTRLSVHEVSFENAPWGTRPQMVTAERASVTLRVLPLLRGDIEIDMVMLEGVDVLVETNAEGAGNWELELQAGKQEYEEQESARKRQEEKSEQEAAEEVEEVIEGEAGEGPEPEGVVLPVKSVRRIHIHDASVTYRDGKTGESKNVTLDRLGLKSSGDLDDLLNETIELNLEGDILGTRVDAGGSVWPARTLLEPDTPSTVNLRLAALGVTAKVQGSIADPLTGNGLSLRFFLKARNLASGLDTLGITSPPLPPLSVAGKLSDPGTSYLVENLDAKVGRSDVAGKVQASFGGARPVIAASLSSDLLDLKELWPLDPDEEPQQKIGKDVGRVIPDAPLPLAPLQVVDANVSLIIDRLMLRTGGQAHQADLSVDLQDGQLDFRSDFGELGGGSFSGRIRVADPGPDARLKVNLTARGADLEGIVGRKTARGGNLNLKLNIAGHGDTVREVVGTMNGTVEAEAGQARIERGFLEILGGDFLLQVVNLVNPLYKNDPTTEVSCAVTRLSLRDGVAIIDRGIGIETEATKIIGAGKVDLKTEKLDLAVRADSKGITGVSVAGLAHNLVRIRGTLAKPALEIDPIGTAGTAARVTGAFMTFGISLLGEALLTRAVIKESACEIARERPLGSADVPDGAGQQADGKEKGVLGRTADGLKKGFNRLLGR